MDKSLEKTHILHRNKNGTISLQHVLSGEVMHSSIGPREEASLLYVEQSEVKRRLNISTLTPLVLFDVGLGAGTNALAAIQEQLALDTPKRPFHIVSFENDLSSMEVAFENRADFPFFENMENPVRTLLKDKVWMDSDLKIHWEIIETDFDKTSLDTLPQPELIYFDFYSPKTNPHLWRVELFEKFLKHSGPETEFFTYSSATRIRVSMLLAGFFVGYGNSTGAKLDTTVAATSFKNLKKPLGQRWFEQFVRSDKKYPHGWTTDQERELLKRLSLHPQFADLEFIHVGSKIAAKTSSVELKSLKK